MKYFNLLIFALVATSCSNSGTPVAQSPSNNSSAPMRSEKLQSSTVHTTEGQADTAGSAAAADAAKGGKWTASGDPIDTTEFDKAIAEADRSLKAKPADGVAKTAAANAYFKRGVALTEARQYAAALGDYRRALKLDPSHEEAKTWEKRIIGIYEMMNKEYPKPGEEPTPLPLAKS